MKINTRIATDAEIASVKKIVLRNAWATFSEDQKRELDEEKWSRRMGELFDMMVKEESHEVFVAEDDKISLFLDMCGLEKEAIR